MNRNDGIYPDPAQVVRTGLNAISGQYPRRPAEVENAQASPHYRPMGDLSRDELKASTSASEAKVAATLEIMRRENAEARSEMKTSLSAFQAESALFREQMRGYIATAQSDNAQFREQVRDGVSGIRIDLANGSKEVEGKISSLRTWVLAGVATGLLAVLMMLAGAFIRNYMSSSTSSGTVVPVVATEGPSKTQRADPTAASTQPPKPETNQVPPPLPTTP